MKLEVRNAEYYKLEEGKSVILFDSFPEAVRVMKGAVKKGSQGVKLWRVKQESGKWSMIEVSYQELFQMLVKED